MRTPTDASKMVIMDVYRTVGGYFNYKILFFKQEGGCWYLYDSDSDNEYPGWRLLVANGLKWFENNNIEDKLLTIPEEMRRHA